LEYINVVFLKQQNIIYSFGIPKHMKDETLGKIIIGSYTALVLAWGSLYTYNATNNYLEDKTAIAKVDVVEGTAIDHSRGYVAFDKSGNGEVDEIKDYRKGMIGGRILASLPYTLRYHAGDKEFDRIKRRYFSQPELKK
jgi:hypothetical protein